MKNLLFTLVFSLPIICFAQKVGINTPTPSDTLDVNGSSNFRGAIKVNGDAGNANEVLMSQGAGADPQWRPTAYTGGGRFWILPANNARSTGSSTGRAGWVIDGAANLTSQEDSLDFGTSNEVGTDFTINSSGTTNNFITINRTGLYHFEGVLRYFATSTLSVTMLPRSTLNFVTNAPSGTDLDILLLEDPMDKTGGSETSNPANNFNYTAKFNLNIHLLSGTTCTFITGFNLLRFPGATDLIAMGVSTGGYISGHFISE